MNKTERGSLLRARFKAKAGSRAWVPPNDPKPRRVEHPRSAKGYPVFQPSYATVTHALPRWVHVPVPKPQVTVSLPRRGSEEATLTKIAKGMFEWNRMEWQPKRRA